MKKDTTPRGWAAPCPGCGETSTPRVNLDSVHLVTCNHCSGEWTIEALEAMIAAWTPIVAWLKLAPERPDA
jgi:hypothetical protein